MLRITIHRMAKNGEFFEKHRQKEDVFLQYDLRSICGKQS